MTRAFECFCQRINTQKVYTLASESIYSWGMKVYTLEVRKYILLKRKVYTFFEGSAILLAWRIKILHAIFGLPQIEDIVSLLESNRKYYTVWHSYHNQTSLKKGKNTLRKLCASVSYAAYLSSYLLSTHTLLRIYSGFSVISIIAFAKSR